MATKEKTTEVESTEVTQDKDGTTTGKRDIVREQEETTKSAQELVQERHMNPEAFQ